MLVNEHPKQGIHTHVELADGAPVHGVRLDLLNGSAPVAFDGTLELAPYESCIVVLGTEAPAADERGGSDAERKVTRVDGPWNVPFAAPDADVAHLAFGESVELDDLHDLPAPNSPAKRASSAIRQALPLLNLAGAALDLGEVFETATVTLDGADLGCRICPPYRFELGTLAAGQHTLTIDVINTLDHAIPDISPSPNPPSPVACSAPSACSGNGPLRDARLALPGQAGRFVYRYD